MVTGTVSQRCNSEQAHLNASETEGPHHLSRVGQGASPVFRTNRSPAAVLQGGRAPPRSRLNYSPQLPAASMSLNQSPQPATHHALRTSSCLYRSIDPARRMREEALRVADTSPRRSTTWGLIPGNLVAVKGRAQRERTSSERPLRATGTCVSTIGLKVKGCPSPLSFWLAPSDRPGSNPGLPQGLTLLWLEF